MVGSVASISGLTAFEMFLRFDLLLQFRFSERLFLFSPLIFSILGIQGILESRLFRKFVRIWTCGVKSDFGRPGENPKLWKLILSLS